jgi:hypothetical protein
MSSKPHPLDIFRSSEQGFDAASRSPRRRRTVSGKVVRSVARPAGTLAGSRPGAPSAKSSAPVPARTAAARRGAPPARGPRRAAPRRAPHLVSNRTLLWTAVVVVAALGLWLGLGPVGSPEAPALKAPGGERQTLFSTGAPGSDGSEVAAPGKPAAPAATPAEPAKPAVKQAATPPTSDVTILAATYVGSAVATAQVAAGELSARGFGPVELVGFPGEDGDFARVELIVGRAADRDGLTGMLARLRSIDDWGTGREASPFHDARFVSHPLPRP